MKTIKDDNIANIITGILRGIVNVSSFIVSQGEKIANIAIKTKKEK